MTHRRPGAPRGVLAELVIAGLLLMLVLGGLWLFLAR